MRIDEGVTEGSDISLYYDPLIAKLITHAPTRAEAASLIREAARSTATAFGSGSPCQPAISGVVTRFYSGFVTFL